MTPTLWAIVAVIAIWVLFSGGSPLVKSIVYRALFVAWAFVMVLATIAAFNNYGLGPAVLAFWGLTLSWYLLIGPMVAMVLSFRRNPREITT